MSRKPQNNLTRTGGKEVHGMDVAWYQLSVAAVLEKLSVDKDTGLSETAVSEAREKYGRNEFSQEEKTGLPGRILKQFKNPLVAILLAAGLLTIVLGEYVDATVIFIALLVNVVIGTVQEERASEAFAVLESGQSREATVIRGGERHVIDATDVVVGDIVELSAGMSVPADARLLEEKNLKVNESALTGESESVTKESGQLSGEREVTERSNMVYKGTFVDAGEGRGVVVAVGDQTEVGEIAEHLAQEEEVETPIQKHMKRLARILSWATLAAVLTIFLLGLLRGQGLISMLLFATAIAVSVVPEGLPAAVTAVLAIGMENILSRGGLVRNLRAAETLGSTTTILTDKTGTLTKAEMATESLIVGDDLFAKQGQGEIHGEHQPQLSPLQKGALEAALSSTSAFMEINKTGEEEVHGEPLERALVRTGKQVGLEKSELDETRSDFLMFSPENRFALSVQQQDNSHTLYVSGAPEVLLARSDHITTEEDTRALSEEERQTISDLQNKESGQGKRIIAVCKKEMESSEIKRAEEGMPADGVVSGLTFLGLILFVDPVRSDAASSIGEAQSAGVHVIMLTGDNPQTAEFVAREVGIVRDKVEPVIGADIEGMDDATLSKALKQQPVFARVLPSQKLRISRLLRDHDEVVAMTGDGINDAPALRSADIGVSLGSGTEVAKEASDLVLLDDSFSIIVSAIEEGRRIIDNLKRIIAQLISASFGELFLIAGALMLALPRPILVAQILWVNIIEGGLITFVFAFEPPDEDVMERSPHGQRIKNLLSKRLLWLIVASGTITGLATFIIYVALVGSMPIATVRTIMFIVLTLDALLFTLSLKNFYRPIHRINFTDNPYLFLSLGLSLIALFGALLFPPLQELLSLTPIPSDWIWLLLGVAIFDLMVVEVAKYFLFQRQKKPAQ